MLETQELWDPKLLNEYLEGVTHKVSLEELTDMVDRIREFNAET
jgi:hypothetical protein